MEKDLSAKKIAWELFKKTGDIRYYSLYKNLKDTLDV
jgi:hypothetical protein